MNAIPKWGPRLARLYSEDIRKLEAKHAGKLSPGTCTWELSIESLFKCMVAAGPRKGVRLLKQAADYLNGVDLDERAHLGPVVRRQIAQCASGARAPSARAEISGPGCPGTRSQHPAARRPLQPLKAALWRRHPGGVH